MTTQPEIDDVTAARMGQLLLALQEFEHWMKVVIDPVFEEDAERVVAGLIAGEPLLPGNLTSKKERVVELSEELLDLISSICARRIMLIHKVVEEFDLDGSIDLGSLDIFLDALNADTQGATRVLKALVLRYGRELGLPEPGAVRMIRGDSDVDAIDAELLVSEPRYFRRCEVGA